MWRNCVFSYPWLVKRWWSRDSRFFFSWKMLFWYKIQNIESVGGKKWVAKSDSHNFHNDIMNGLNENKEWQDISLGLKGKSIKIEESGQFHCCICWIQILAYQNSNQCFLQLLVWFWARGKVIRNVTRTHWDNISDTQKNGTRLKTSDL